ncbi:E3 ubiquitin-protein ligase [Canna indica]|uniref:E3 ubiquitin protein ligase n=1 Tax=Canna indica TaxID=4628 RepID=A0AAQ3QLT1_9LILI|nr:E3 ubiquitin-protein ligase [Canna indica]
MEDEATAGLGSAEGGGEECSPAAVIDRQQVDAAVLHYQNQRLVQQLETQKAEMHTLEGKFKELREKQSSYDKSLMNLNKMWNQLVDDLTLLSIRAGGDLRYLQALDHEDPCEDALATCPTQEIFLCRLIRANPAEKGGGNAIVNFVQEALASRHSTTTDLMKYVLEMINSRRAKNECLSSDLHGKLSPEDAISQLRKYGESLREVVNNMRQAVDVLSQKHKMFAEEINTYKTRLSTAESEIKRLSGELEESMAELEESRRKMAIMQMHKHGASTVHASIANAANGSSSPDKSADKTMGFKDLKDSIEEAKALAASRLLELQEAQEDFFILSKQLEDLQNQLKDEQYVVSSKPYTLLNDQLQHINAELARYKGLIESLQADRSNYLQRENELNDKEESADAIKTSVSNYEAKLAELELQIQSFLVDKNKLESKLEEAKQDLGRKDIKDEINVMASALTKEMEMMESQLNRSKEAASEAHALREEAESLRPLLNKKIDEHKILSDRYAEEMVEMKSLRALVEDLEKEKQELQIIMDMYGQECLDTRTIVEIKESENKAHVQADLLKATLAEHGLELRVKAANDAEATCQQRLLTAEAEIPELRAKLDASERDVSELQEAIRIKDAEGEAYISEIETIGQAYEDMQTQNQHLLQLVADRDAYHIKLVSDSVKMKQTHSSLLAEKQVISKQLQQVNGSLEFFKTKIAHGEEQMKLHVTQAIKTSSENRHININLEKTKLELVDAEKETKWLRSTVGSFEKEYERNQKKIAELKMELEKERNERKKLDEELEEVKSEVAEMSSENEEVAIQKLQDEIKECKAILKCGVCFDRPKEVVITKCFHLFCYPCIQRNLEIRHRKCPGCGTPFGQNDVREVKI